MFHEKSLHKTKMVRARFVIKFLFEREYMKYFANFLGNHWTRRVLRNLETHSKKFLWKKLAAENGFELKKTAEFD